MNSESPFSRYVSTRAHLYRQLDDLRLQVDDWLREMTNRAPNMPDLARLEAMHANCQRLLRDLQAAEDRFLDGLLRQLGQPRTPADSASPRADGGSPTQDWASPSSDGASASGHQAPSRDAEV